ncbi:MAG: Penicillin-binding protein activator LpoA [Candidatus Celerinatantimonas neptuna]|nr:MAG: Penicillin-binding protein activator LpoA [Candidatus Celerinatantimonas neptuna]
MKRPLSWHSYYLMACLVFLSACTSNQLRPLKTDVIPPTITGLLVYPPNDYLTQAKRAKSQYKFDWQLLAAKAYLEHGQMGKGQQLLQTLQKSAATERQHAAWLLVSAYASELNQHQEQALKTLHFPAHWQLPDDYWRTYYQKLAQLNVSQQHPIAAASALISLNSFLNEAQRQANRKQIWDLLKPIDSFTLRSYEQPGNNMLNGYLELIAISNEPVNSPQQLLKKLDQWKQAYPNNPAIHFVQGQLSKALQSKLYNPTHIAILLPLSGHFAQSGQRIQDGILAAYSDLSQKGRDKPQLTFFDTNEQPVSTIEAKIHQSDCDFVIGPLLKSNVKAYAQLKVTLPWLALNDIDNRPQATQNSRDIYSLSLDPQTEAAQAAQQMLQDDEHHPLLFVPDTDIGHRMAISFSNVWKKENKDAPDITFYSKDNLQNSVRQMLKTNQSIIRIQQIRRLLGRNIKAEVRSRRDSSAVYIVANNLETKLIVPFISVTISPFASSLHLYGSSRTQQSNVNNTELDGMMISEVPWLLNQYAPNATRFTQLWPQANDTDKLLYAMGYDAYHILPHLQQMRGFKDYHVQGLTGILGVKENGTIKRRLIWSQYRNGHLEPL